jgi:hypothetical protein
MLCDTPNKVLSKCRDSLNVPLLQVAWSVAVPLGAGRQDPVGPCSASPGLQLQTPSTAGCAGLATAGVPLQRKPVMGATLHSGGSILTLYSLLEIGTYRKQIINLIPANYSPTAASVQFFPVVGTPAIPRKQKEAARRTTNKPPRFVATKDSISGQESQT